MSDREMLLDILDRMRAYLVNERSPVIADRARRLMWECLNAYIDAQQKSGPAHQNTSNQ